MVNLFSSMASDGIQKRFHFGSSQARFKVLQYRSESRVNCSGVLRTDQGVFYFLTGSLGSS